MTTILIIGLPVLGVASQFAVDFVYCSVLNNECKPDALEAVGFFFATINVILISSVIYGLILSKVQHKAMHDSQQFIALSTFGRGLTAEA